jgi:hypothetical protein
MNLETEKQKIIEWIKGLSDQSLIEKIKLIKENKLPSDWWDEISEEEKLSIERGIEDIRSGRIIPHDQVKKHYEKWL